MPTGYAGQASSSTLIPAKKITAYKLIRVPLVGCKKNLKGRTTASQLTQLWPTQPASPNPLAHRPGYRRAGSESRGPTAQTRDPRPPRVAGSRHSYLQSGKKKNTHNKQKVKLSADTLTVLVVTQETNALLAKTPPQQSAQSKVVKFRLTKKILGSQHKSESDENERHIIICNSHATAEKHKNTACLICVWTAHGSITRRNPPLWF